MKTKCSYRVAPAALLLALLPIAGFAERSDVAALMLPPSNARVAITVTMPNAASPFRESAAVAPSLPGHFQWSDISDCTTEMREKFFAGCQQLEALITEQINGLTIRRATARDTADAAQLDQVIQEMNTARFFLESTVDTLRRATSTPAWEQQKAKIGLAWTKSQAAYHKLEPRPAN